MDVDVAIKAQTPLILALLNWGSIPDDEEIPLEKCSAFLVEMTKHVSSKAVASLDRGWVKEARDMIDRFEGRMVAFGKKWAQDTWTTVGSEEVIVTFDSCKYIPKPLQPIIQIAKNANLILENIQPINLAFENYDAELPLLVKPVKKWMAILGLDKTLIASFFGQPKLEQIQEFNASIVASVEKVLNFATGLWKRTGQIVDKYRWAMEGTWNSFQL